VGEWRWLTAEDMANLGAWTLTDSKVLTG
jgi:hypothetical protein